MDYKVRALPTREILSKVKLQNIHIDVSGVDLVLSLITTVDLIRANIYEQLDHCYDISEGKFILLMSLYSEGEATTGELAIRIGVTPATVSVMVKRMLATSTPLILMSKNNEDGRSRLISLTDSGLSLIKKMLPEHLAAIDSFASVLNKQEREALIIMLRKLLRKNS